MILLLSIYGDISTDDTIDWLLHYQVPFYRLNDEDLLNHSSIRFYFDNDSGGMAFELIDENNNRINSKNIKAVWYRKFNFLQLTGAFTHILKDYGNDISKQYSKEFYETTRLLFKCLSSKKWLTHYLAIAPNKVDVLSKAKKCGLDTPNTLITNNKKDLQSFTKDYQEVIAKSVKDADFLNFKGNIISLYTTPIMRFQKVIPKRFGFTLFQERIEKKFELRIFYLNKVFYSMAIMSQLDPQIKDDFRNYNTTSPNRWVPYELPNKIKDKLILLMEDLNLNTGSIDMIVNKQNDYIFLEVNPTGQFGMISKTCNYPIEKEIAKFLINLYYEETNNVQSDTQ